MIEDFPREEEMLGQLAELDLRLAKEVYARAMAAEDAAEMALLVGAYRGLGRSMRLTLSLFDRLRRERQRGTGEAPRPEPEVAAADERRRPQGPARPAALRETDGRERERLPREWDADLDLPTGEAEDETPPASPSNRTDREAPESDLADDLTARAEPPIRSSA